MKYLFIFLISFSLVSCLSAQTEAPPVIVEANFKIMQKTEKTATLYSDRSPIIYEVDSFEGIEKEKQYFFILQVGPGETGKNRQATVLFYHISIDQARRNINEALLFYNQVKD